MELKENAWTLIFSSWPAQEKYDPNNKDALWGAYGYTPDKDVLRAPMKVETLPFSIDQFTIDASAGANGTITPSTPSTARSKPLWNFPR